MMKRSRTIFKHAGELLAVEPALRFTLEEPRCYTFATIGTAVTIAAGAASLASMGYAAAQGAPQVPGGSASKDVAEAQANALPFQRSMAAAEQEGGRAVRWGYTQTTVSGAQRAQLQSQLDALNKQITSAQQWAGTGANANPSMQNWVQGLTQKRDQLQTQIAQVPANGGTVYRNDSTGAYVPASEAVADFKGFGTADVEGKLARQMSDIQTNLGAKYGVAFAKQATADARQADPLGFAARDEEKALIDQQIKNPMPINPLATELDQRMKARVEAGSGLDSMSRDLLDKEIARANSDRGGATSADAVAGQMSTGMEGAARRQANLGQTQAWLSSGSTPEDQEYRREQQNLANLTSFIQGRTPESQFGALSGAAKGAAPFYPGQQLPQQPGNASTVGPAFSVAAWQRQIQGQGSQANSWMAGLSGLLSAVGSGAKAFGRG